MRRAEVREGRLVMTLFWKAVFEISIRISGLGAKVNRRFFAIAFYAMVKIR